MAIQNTALDITSPQAQTRALLALWDLGAARDAIKKSDFTRRITRTKEKAGDYQGLLDELEKAGAIAITNENRVASITLTPQGLQMLDQGLKSIDFEFDGQQVGVGIANALVKWIREMTVPAPANFDIAEITQPKENAMANNN